MSCRLHCLHRLSVWMVAATLAYGASYWLLPEALSFAAEKQREKQREQRTPFVLRLAQELSCTESEAEEKLAVVFQEISVELIAGQSVTIPNFGRFFVYEKPLADGERAQDQSAKVRSRRAAQSNKQRARRAGRTAAKRFPRFRASEVLKANLNQEPEAERREAR